MAVAIASNIVMRRIFLIFCLVIVNGRFHRITLITQTTLIILITQIILTIPMVLAHLISVFLMSLFAKIQYSERKAK